MHPTTAMLTLISGCDLGHGACFLHDGKRPTSIRDCAMASRDLPNSFDARASRETEDAARDLIVPEI